MSGTGSEEERCMKDPSDDTATRRPSRFGRALGTADAATMRVEAVLNGAAGWLVLVLMFLLVTVVVLRGVVGQPLRGQVDFVQMMVPCFAFLGLSYCYRLAGHVRMDIVLRTMPDRPRIAAELAGALVALAVAVVLAIGTYRDTARAMRFGDTTMDVQLLTWPARGLLFAGLVLFGVRMILVVLGWARALRDPTAVPIAVPVAPPGEEPDDWLEPIGETPASEGGPMERGSPR